MPSRAIVPAKDRFWKHVNKTDECWEWTASLRPNGYGQFAMDGKRIGYAHRAAWTLFVGAIPDDLFVLHKCDNRRCVRLDHLFLGTQKDNMQDCRAKGRIRNKAFLGAENSSTKLTEEIVHQIRQSTKSHSHLAETYGVARSLIWSIRKRRIWKHVQ